MAWEQIFTLIASNLVIFFWLRTEASADRREASADRRDINKILFEMKEEMKDFHGRLCAIEEKRKQ